MNNSFLNSNSNLPISRKIEYLIEKFNTLPDLKSKEKFILDISTQSPGLSVNLITKIPFETLTMNLDECPNLDEIFSFLELVHSFKQDLSNKLMEYLFILDNTEKADLAPVILKNQCYEYLEKNLGVKNFSEALDRLNNEIDERKIALLLTDIAIINEEISKRLLWELFSKFKNSEPKHFRDSLKILKWASEDLFLVISIIGTEKLLQSPNLNEFNSQLTLFISEEPDLIYPLIIEVPDSKKAITELFNNASLEDMIDFLNILEAHSPDYIESFIDFNFDSMKILHHFSIGKLKTKLQLLKKIIEYEDSFLYRIFIEENYIILKSLIIEIKENFDLENFYLCLNFFNTLDKLLVQDLLVHIDPKIVTENLFDTEKEDLVINTFIIIASTNYLYLYYTLKAEFSDFLKWLEFFISKLEDLETLALFLVSFQRIFNDAPELPLILTTIVKKLQREENIDDLGVFLGIIGNSEPDLLKLILNNLLPHLKLYPTDKIGYLLMTTSLYHLETGLDLVKSLAARFSSEYDIKLLRKSFESIILANSKVAEELIKDNKFNTELVIKNFNSSDILEKVLFLETILPIGKEIIDKILQNKQFIKQIIDFFTNSSVTEIIKILSNSNWFGMELCQDIGRILSERKFNLDDFYTIIHTSSWSNKLLCKKIVYWTDVIDMAEKFEEKEKNNSIIDSIITIFYEIDPEKTEKLLKNYSPIQD